MQNKMSTEENLKIFILLVQPGEQNRFCTQNKVMLCPFNCTGATKEIKVM
jgi:hypothetical protein